MKFAPGTPPEVKRAAEEKWLKSQQGGGAKPRASAPAPATPTATPRPRATPSLPKPLPAGVKPKAIPLTPQQKAAASVGSSYKATAADKAMMAGQVAAAKSKMGMAKGGAVKKKTVAKKKK
jgi:hypothetical protein